MHNESDARPVLILSSTLLTDRILRYTDVLERISERLPTVVWSNPLHSISATRTATTDSRFEPFPAVTPGKFGHQLLRRVADYAWDHRSLSASRNSFWHHRRRTSLPRYHRILRAAGRGVARAGMHEQADRMVEAMLLRDVRSREAEFRLQELRPRVVVATSPFRTAEPGIVVAARRCDIPVIAFVTSWDNISTKGRLGLTYDAYLVWSDDMRRELHEFYPKTRHLPVFVVGAPQFDVFAKPNILQTRQEFCQENGLNPHRPIILYGLGSPNLLREHFGAIDLARRIDAGELGDVQMLVRPHPVFNSASELAPLARSSERTVIQACDRQVQNSTGGMQDEYQIRQWVNTFYHADVVVNLASTIAIDAARFDRPVVNLDYDPEPGRPSESLIQDINHSWNHFKPVAESGAVWLVRDTNELVHAIREYLRHPELHRRERRRIVERICGFSDGRCGARFAAAVLNYCEQLDTLRGSGTAT